MFSKDNFVAAAKAEERKDDIDEAIATPSHQKAEDIEVLPIAGQPRDVLNEMD